MNNKIKKEKILIKNGVWKTTGEKLFWINMVQNKVFWLGMNNRTTENELGENWCHVGNGTIIDNPIISVLVGFPFLGRLQKGKPKNYR